MLTRLRAITSSPLLCFLCVQGSAGVIQLAAFFHLEGRSYLNFSASFVTGTIIGSVLSLNLEADILAGRARASAVRYLAFVWLIGLAGLARDYLIGQPAPGLIFFACWALCLRLYLALSAGCRWSPWGPCVAGLAVVSAFALGSIFLVSLVALLGFPIMTMSARDWRVDKHARMAADILTSVRDFSRFLPHTISGFIFGYLDRYAALHFLSPDSGESYLRNLQICAWASFLAYPFLYQARASFAREGKILAGALASRVGLLAALLAVSVSAIATAMVVAGKGDHLSLSILIFVFAATMMSQVYQMVSILNFVHKRFATVNMITIISAASTVAVAAVVLSLARRPEAVALVLLWGWSLQALMTVAIIRHRQGDVPARASETL